MNMKNIDDFYVYEYFRDHHNVSVSFPAASKYAASEPRISLDQIQDVVRSLVVVLKLLPSDLYTS